VTAILAQRVHGEATPLGTAEPEPSWPLTAAIHKGDEAAYARFYELWFDRVFALARRVSRRDESFCLDVVQECMLRVVRGMRPLRSEASVSAWMARTVFTVAVDHIRAEERRARRERAAAAHRSDEVAPPSLDADEQRAWLRARLMELPERDRELILLRFSGDETLAAVGAAQGITGHAAHGRIFRILARLRRAAEGLFDD
jgi:RNA polymerase sigma-70 factor (ECF subfamily)